MTTTRLLALLATISLTVTAGCGGGSDDTSTSSSTGSTTTSPTSPSTTASTTATTATTTTSTMASTTSTSTTGSTTTATAVPPTTIGEVEGAIDTGASTIWGLHLFARRPSDDVVHVVSDRLGQPSSDTGFQDMPPEFACTGNEAYRVVRWGDLRITFTQGFTDEATAPDDGGSTERMIAFSVGDDAAGPLSPTDEPPTDPTPTGISTDEGIAIGSTRDDVRAAIPDDQALEGFDGDKISVFDPTANDGAPTATLFLLTDDVVTGIGAGPPDCIDSDGM